MATFSADGFPATIGRFPAALWAKTASSHAMPEERRKGLLDEMEDLTQRRSQKKAAKKKADLDLDQVW